MYLKTKRPPYTHTLPTTPEHSLAEGLAYYSPIERNCPRDGSTCRHNGNFPTNPCCQNTSYFTITRIPICLAWDLANEAYELALTLGEPTDPGMARAQGKEYFWTGTPGKYCGHVGMKTMDGKCYLCKMEKDAQRATKTTEPKPISPRQAAIDAGQDWYMPTDPCRKGHIALRRVNNGECSQCTAESRAATATAPAAVTPARLAIQNDPAWADAVISYDEAKTAGMKVYRTGDPCRAGHKGWRYVSTRNCIVCMGR